MLTTAVPDKGLYSYSVRAVRSAITATAELLLRRRVND